MSDKDDQRWEKFINVFERARRKAWDKLKGVVSLGVSYERMKNRAVITARAKDLNLVMTFEVNKNGALLLPNNPGIVELPNIHSDGADELVARSIVDTIERAAGSKSK